MAGELQRPPSRAQLNRELMVRAATSWDGLLALVAVAAAGVALNVFVLVPVAIALWVAASVWHYFDGSQADVLREERRRRVAAPGGGERLDPATLCAPVARQLQAARAQEASIRQTITETEIAADLGGEVDALVRAFETTARRADRLVRALERQRSNGQGAEALTARLRGLRRGPADARTQDDRALAEALEAQLQATGRAERLRDRFFSTMERMVAELGTIDAEILGMSAGEAAAAQEQVAGQLRDLRELVGGLAGELQRTEGDAAVGA